MSKDKSLKICIVGAGATGISAALALREQGYTHVTVLEKADRIGGQCYTVIENGVPLEHGAFYVLPDYRTINRLAAKMGARLHKADHLVHLGVDGRTRPFGQPATPYPLGKRLVEFLRMGMQFFKYPTLLRYGSGLGEVTLAQSKDLALPYKDWIKKYGFNYFHEVAYPLMRSWGFGYEEQNIPFLYILRVLPAFARNGNSLDLWDLAKADLFQFENGYGDLWQRAAAGFDIRLGVQIERIERRENGGTVYTASGPVEFDRLILTCRLDKTLDFLDVSPEERELFSKIQSLEIWHLASRVEGVGNAVFLDRFQSFSTAGHMLSFGRYSSLTNWYYSFGYTASLSDEEIKKTWGKDMQDLGGQPVGETLFSRWSYFPHYASAEVAAGYHVRLEKLQGQRATYYAGEIMSVFGVDPVAAYAQKLVKKFF